MARIGVLSLYATGHLNPALALARSLMERQHTVTLFNLADTRTAIESQGVRFIPFGQGTYPTGALQAIFERIGKLQGAEGFAYFLERMITLAEVSFGELPPLLEADAIDLLIVDQLFPGGATVAQHGRLPYVSLASAIAVNPDPALPPPTLPWPFDASESGLARNAQGWAGVQQAFTPWLSAENRQRAAWGLVPYTDLLVDSMSPTAQITQMPVEFDLPRLYAPGTLHFVGPLSHPAARDAVARRAPFPWDRLTGKPLIYASMGTLQNGLDWIFRAILDACATTGAQLVLSLGGSALDPASLHPLPPEAIVVPYAPQFDLLARSALCITHAGLNTALDCATHGVPMVAVPITNDQPGVAARIAHAGLGVVLPLAELTPETLAACLRTVLGDPSFAARASDMQARIAALQPLVEATRIVEAALPA